MSWKRSVRNFLMGASYEEMTVVAPTEVTAPLIPVPLEVPESALAREEALISALQQAEFLADAPVLSSQDPTVRAATFRIGFVPPAKTTQTETRGRRQLEADAPAAPGPAPLLTSPELDRAEKLAERRAYQGLTPVMRKFA
jgi:hypothetical protein